MNTDGTSQDTGSNGLSEDQAADRIAALLTPTGDSDGGETRKEPKKAKADDEAPELDEAPDDADEAPEDEAEDEESDEADEDDASEAQELDDQTPIKLKLGEEEVEVTLHDLKRGFLREQDYTRKTMELAEARKALEPETQALRQEREQYANLLPQLFASLQQQIDSPEMEALRHSDPAEWAARREEFRERDAAIRSEYERVTQQQAEDAAKERSTLAQQEAHALIKAEPAFAKPGVYEDVKTYALQAGFPEADVQDELNHRLWITFYKAREYDRLKAKAPQTKATVEAVKTAKPGVKATQPSKVTELTRAKQRLAKTGRVEDAQAAIERMLG